MLRAVLEGGRVRDAAFAMLCAVAGLGASCVAAHALAGAPGKHAATTIPVPGPPRGEEGAATSGPYVLPQSTYARIERRGHVIGPTFPLPPASGASEPRYLFMLGEGAVARSAWIVDSTQEAPVEGFPVGSAVAGSATVDGHLYLLLQSAAVLDQPAGLRTIFAVDAPYDARPDRGLVALDGVYDAGDLARALERRPADVSFDDALPILRRLADPGDAQVFIDLVGHAEWLRVWQGAYLERAGVFDWSRRERAADLARRAIEASSCEGDVCEAPADATREGGAVVFERAAGGLLVRVRAFLDASPPPLRRDPAPWNRGVGGASEATRAVYLEHIEEAPGAELEAPFGADGIVGFAAPWMAVRRGGFGEVYRAELGFEGADEVRFVDVDDDGRFDVVARSSATGCSRVLRGPASLADGRVSAGRPSLVVDLAASMAALGAPDLDGAVREAVATDAQAVPASIACGVIKQVRADGVWGSAMLPGGRVLHVSAASPGCVSRVETPLEARDDDLAPLVHACDTGTLSCDPHRPACETLDGSAAVSFGGAGSALRISTVLIVDPLDDD